MAICLRGLNTERCPFSFLFAPVTTQNALWVSDRESLGIVGVESRLINFLYFTVGFQRKIRQNEHTMCNGKQYLASSLNSFIIIAKIGLKFEWLILFKRENYKRKCASNLTRLAIVHVK